MRAAVIGHPISHSLSPAIFRVIAEVEESTLVYNTEAVTPENLATFLTSLRESDDFVGVNVTIPHKEAILPFLDQVSDEVRAIGAANVIQVGRGKLIGHNTDVIGIRRTFEDQKFTATGKTCILLGAGGAARAVAYVLGEQGAKSVIVYNPRSNRGDALCETMRARFTNVSFQAVQTLDGLNLGELSLIVNCTPIGMKGEESDFFDAFKNVRFTTSTLAFDLLYTPKSLLFLNTLKASGASTADGLNMLIEQALATWEIWIGKLHHPKELKERLVLTLIGILKSREDPTPLYLTGFMGIGKSTVARELSYALNRTYLDTDRVIEEDTKLSIPEIFDKQGEATFRAHEKAALKKVAAGTGTVIALGGGALNDPENLETVLNRGTLIYLKATEQTLFKRLRRRASQRPLLANLDEAGIRQKITELLTKRAPIYERAPLQIEVKPEDTPHDTAQSVLRALGGAR